MKKILLLVLLFCIIDAGIVFGLKAFTSIDLAVVEIVVFVTICLAIMYVTAALVVFFLGTTETFFCIMRDNSFAAVQTAGSVDGAINRYLLRKVGWSINKSGKVIKPDNDHQEPPRIDFTRPNVISTQAQTETSHWIERLVDFVFPFIHGVYWIGIPPFQTLRTITLTRNSYRAKTKDGVNVFEIEGVTDKLTQIPVEWTHLGFLLDEMEAQGPDANEAAFGLVSLGIICGASLEDAYLFLTLGDPFRTFESVLKEALRGFVGSRDFVTLSRFKTSDISVDQEFKKLLDGANEELIKTCGLRILAIRIVDVAEGGGKETKTAREQADLEVYRAERKKQATITEAEGEARAIELKGAASNRVLVGEAAAYGDNPGALAMAKTGVGVYAPGRDGLNLNIDPSAVRNPNQRGPRQSSSPPQPPAQP